MKEDIWLSRKVVSDILACLESYVVHAELCGNHLHTDKRMLAEELVEMLHENVRKGV